MTGRKILQRENQFSGNADPLEGFTLHTTGKITQQKGLMQQYFKLCIKDSVQSTELRQ